MTKHEVHSMRVLGWLLLVAGAAGAGCLFEPRTPETGGTGEVCYRAIPQAQQLNVYANLDGALRCLQARTYLDQLAEDFVFVPSPGVQSQFPELFPDPETSWTRDQEEQFLDRLFSDADAIVSLIYEEVQPPTGGNEPLYEGRYSIKVTVDGSEIEYTGEAFFTLRQERTAWFILRWEEKESENPFGELRAALLSQGG